MVIGSGNLHNRSSIRVYVASLLIVVNLTIILCLATVTSAENLDVDHIYQRDYEHIGWSACGPTSITMLLQYYFPNSEIDVPDVYHSGTQTYQYLGPAGGYRDVSFVPADNGEPSDVTPGFESYYDGIPDEGMNPYSAVNYLNNIWGGQAELTSEDEISEVVDIIEAEIDSNRPVIVNVWYYYSCSTGICRNGHYVVFTGYEDNGNSDQTDDYFYVNDPINDEPTTWNYDEFTTEKYKGRIITFNPRLNEEQRRNTTVVDGIHVELDDLNPENTLEIKDKNEDYVWWEFYNGDGAGGGDWYYPIEDKFSPEGKSHSATWEPDLPVEGVYEIHVIFYDNNEGEDVKYEIYYPDNAELPIGMNLIKQLNDGNWRDVKLGTFYLKEGSYVMIKDVPAQANVDAVRFEYISPPESLDLIFLIDTTGSMGDDIANVKASASEIVEAIDSKGYDYRIAIADYRDYPVAPYGGWLDYPYHLDLPFSNDKNDIINAINGLTLGWGGDWQESVYSGLVAAMKDPCKEIPCESSANYGWREGVNKAIILIGDAPPHDKDPIHEIDPIFDCDTCTEGCTIEDVAYWSENIDPILVYSVVIGSDSTVYNAFSEISERTGGKVYTSLTASDIVDTIIEVIGDIGETPNLGVSVDINPIINLVNPGNTVTYSISLTNTGTITDTYDLSIDLENFVGGYRGYPTSIQETWINLDKTSVEIEPDATETVSLTISVPNNWAGMEDIIYPFNVIIKSETDELIINSSAAELEIIADKRSMIEYSKLETIWLSELIQSASIDDEIKNSLLDKLTNATLKLDQAILNVESGKYKQANNMLSTSQNVINAFINQVEAQYDKKIMQPDAEMLMGEANTIFKDIESAKNI